MAISSPVGLDKISTPPGRAECRQSGALVQRQPVEEFGAAVEGLALIFHLRRDVARRRDQLGSGNDVVHWFISFVRFPCWSVVEKAAHLGGARTRGMTFSISLDRDSTFASMKGVIAVEP